MSAEDPNQAAAGSGLGGILKLFVGIAVLSLATLAVAFALGAISRETAGDVGSKLLIVLAILGAASLFSGGLIGRGKG